MKKVLFYPDPPIQLPGHTLSKTISYFKILGYELTNDIDSNWDMAVHWTRMDGNKISCKVPERLLNNRRLVLNKFLNNISKSYVDKMFTEAFGYSSIADTTKHGYCIRKSERQSAHDGEFVKIPCEKQNGYFYQLLIDNRISKYMLCDIRLPIFLGETPLVFLKSKSIEGTFENTKSLKRKYWTDSVEAYLTEDEIKKIKIFCKNTGCDIGEIDTLRDNSTGKLYIIDINHTPGGDVFKFIKDGESLRRQLALFLQKQLDRYG